MVVKVEECLRQEVFKNILEKKAKTEDFMDVISTNNSGRSKKSMKKRAQDLVAKWLDGKLVDSLDDATFMHEKAFIDLFIR